MKPRRSHFGLLALLAAGVFVPLGATPALAQDASAVREVRVEVDGGYSPSRIELTAGERVRLVFVRREGNRGSVADGDGAAREPGVVAAADVDRRGAHLHRAARGGADRQVEPV